MKTMLEAAKAAKAEINRLTTEQKNAALNAMADALLAQEAEILAAKVAKAVQANLLILLSDIDGLYTADPHKDPNAVLLYKVTKIDDRIMNLAGVSSTTQGTGGMVTKLHAAEICLACGCDMVIANGNNPDHLYDILDGKDVGTKFTEERV